MLKKSITTAVLSIFLLSILLPACDKKEQVQQKQKITRLYTRQEALKMYHKDQIPEKDGINNNREKMPSAAQYERCMRQFFSADNELCTSYCRSVENNIFLEAERNKNKKTEHSRIDTAKKVFDAVWQPFVFIVAVGAMILDFQERLQPPPQQPQPPPQQPQLRPLSPPPPPAPPPPKDPPKGFMNLTPEELQQAAAKLPDLPHGYMNQPQYMLNP